MTADEKRARVQQMRQKNKRLKDMQVSTEKGLNSAGLNSPPKVIHPDERPIKAATSYNFDEMPIGGGNKNYDDRPIGGGKAAQPVSQNNADGGMMMTFDFAAPATKPKAKKKDFLRRKAQPTKAQQKEEEVKEEVSPKKTGNDSKSPKKNFLKRGQRNVYDPLKAVKEAKLRQQEEERLKLEQEQKERELQEEIQRRIDAGEDPSELMSMVNYDEELVNINDDKSSMRKLSKDTSFRQGTESAKSKFSTKNATAKKVGDKKPTTTTVSNQFQDLGYLKAIPKRVDCWLSNKPKKTTQTPKNRVGGSISASSDKVDFSKTAKIYSKLPSNRYVDPQEQQNMNEAEKNRKEFLRKHGSPSTFKKGRVLGSQKSAEHFPEMGYLGASSPRLELDGQNMSYDTYGLYDDNNSVSQNNIMGNTTVSQDDEKLESLLERLEESRAPEKGFTMQERNMIMEDTQYLAMLSGSDTLYRIFQLM